MALCRAAYVESVRMAALETGAACVDGRGWRVMDEQKQKQPVFRRAKPFLLKDILPLIRSSGYSHKDESGYTVKLSPECEEWTHVIFNVNSGFLDLLGQLTVTDLDCDDDGIRLWVKTDDYNWFAPSEKPSTIGKPMTNADRIRSMTDEELAQVLRNPCDIGEHIPAEWCRSRGCGYQCSLDWLRQEAT